MLSTLDADRTRAAFLEAQILNLETSLAALRLEHTLVQQRLQSYIYPVLTLPPEIVSEIFIHVLPPYPRCPPLTGGLSPTSLTHICRKWREIALSTPALWRAIWISYEDRIPAEGRARMSDLWLRRSGSCPLSIRLDDDDGEEEASKSFTSVVPYRARWEYLELGDAHFHHIHFYTIAGSMPLLRHLHLVLPTIDILGNVVDFGELPLLRSAYLNDIAALRIILPWAQLTSLALLDVYMDVCVSILRQTSSLLRCELGIIFSPNGHGVNITLPYLESLGLDDGRSLPVIQCLEFFSTPVLRRLRVPEQFLGTDPVLSLKEFASRSGGKLQEVRITGARSLSRTSYREALHSVPRLFFTRSYYGGDLEIWSDSDSDSSDITNLGSEEL
ncbi:hypothetical protein K438DRAFT_1814358 [Mycena galopus ATCC 62051]|nr:hypothetical protein K438DRAFT_1814358 [Mycena galopus ATCC 62051]